MKIKKCLVAATLSVGLACSAAALAPTTDVSPIARIGFILVYQSTKDLNDPVKGMVRAGATGAGAAAGTLARISHQAACRRQKAHGFQEVDRDADDRADCGLRWPRPRGSFGPVRAHAPSTVVPAMLSVASTRTEPKSSAIITAPGEKCGLATIWAGTKIGGSFGAFVGGPADAITGGRCQRPLGGLADQS